MPMVPFERPYMISYSCSIVTIALTLTVLEILLPKVVCLVVSGAPYSCLNPHFGVIPFEFLDRVWSTENWKDGAI